MKNSVNELRDKTEIELKEDLNFARLELSKLRIDLFQGKVNNINTIRTTRKRIAKRLTLINENRNNIAL